jgi:hypothetical protein
MPTDREVLEAAARGLAVMVHYRNGPKTKRARELMLAEVQTIAEWARASGLDGPSAHARVVEPVQVGLLLRYGDAEATRLFDEFVSAFEGGGGLMLRKA